MSYILDALKKSEEERHQGQVPNLGSGSTLIYKQNTKPVVWPWFIAALLLLNIGVVAYWMLSQPETVSPEYAETGITELSTHEETLSPVSPTTTAAALVSESGVKQASVSIPASKAINAALPNMTSSNVTSPNVRQLNKTVSESTIEIPAEYSNGLSHEVKKIDEVNTVQEVSIVEELPQIIRPKSGARAYVEPVSNRNSVDAGYDNNAALTRYGAYVPSSGELLITPEKSINTPYDVDVTPAREESYTSSVLHISDMPVSFQRNIPKMSFNSHIFSDSPEYRRVMINDLYLRERESFSGMVIEEITEEGVVLSFNGESFKVSVLRNWQPPR